MKIGTFWAILTFSEKRDFLPFLRVIFWPWCCPVALQMHRSKELSLNSKLVNFELLRSERSSWANFFKMATFGIHMSGPSKWVIFGKCQILFFWSFYAFFKWSKTISRPRFAPPHALRCVKIPFLWARGWPRAMGSYSQQSVKKYFFQSAQRVSF